MVAVGGHYSSCSDRNDQHGARHAWLHGAIDGRPFERDPVAGSLGYSVLFGMDRPHTMLALVALIVYDRSHQMPDVVTVGHTWWRPDIASGQDPAVLDNDTAGPAPIAGGALSHHRQHFVKVLIPTGPLHRVSVLF